MTTITKQLVRYISYSNNNNNKYRKCYLVLELYFILFYYLMNQEENVSLHKTCKIQMFICSSVTRVYKRACYSVRLIPLNITKQLMLSKIGASVQTVVVNLWDWNLLYEGKILRLLSQSLWKCNILGSLCFRNM